MVDLDVDGFEQFFDIAEFEDVPQAIRENEVDFIVSRDRDSLEMAVEEEIPYLSTVASAEAYVEALESFDGDLEVAAVTDRPKDTAEWGSSE